MKGLVLADDLDQAMLACAELAHRDLWIAEGLPDFVSLVSSFSDTDEDAPPSWD